MRLDFVILCLDRTGSTYLQELLDSHPDVRCFGELFSNEAFADPEHFARSGHTDPLNYMAEVTSGLTKAAVGFKLPLNSIRAFPASLDLLVERDVRVIRLVRENHLAQYVSWRLFQRGLVAKSRQGSYGDEPLVIEPDKAIRSMAQRAFHDRLLDEIARRHPHLRITYEELARDPTLDETLDFLGVQAASLRSDLRKLRIRPLSEVIENWDELSDALAGTPYEGFLDPGAA